MEKFTSSNDGVRLNKHSDNIGREGMKQGYLHRVANEPRTPRVLFYFNILNNKLASFPKGI